MPYFLSSFSPKRPIVSRASWLLAAVLALPLKWPLLVLPGIGRDEAVYVYWSRQGEPFYAPLLQWALALVRLLPVPELAAIRTLALGVSVLNVYLVDRLLREARVSASRRRLAALVFATLPWQMYVGGIVHPDGLFLASLLLFCLFMARGHLAGAALIGGAIALSKPVGLALLPVVSWLLVARSRSRTQAAFLLMLVAVAASPVWLNVHPAMLAALSEFGRLSALSPVLLIGLGLGAVVFLGGVLLPIAAMSGARRVLCTRRRVSRPPDHLPALALAAALLLVFLVAAMLNRQIKGNWILPALVLLAIAGRWPMPRWSPWLLSVQLLLSVGLGWAMQHPRIIERLEARFTALAAWYVHQAGERDARLSLVRTWHQRAAEYRSLQPLPAQLLDALERERGGPVRPRWIVSDDYGLAAQLAFYWRAWSPRIIVPGDGLLVRSIPPPETERLTGEAVVVALRRCPAQIWPRLKDVQWVGRFAIPGQGVSLALARAEGRLRSAAP